MLATVASGDGPAKGLDALGSYAFAPTLVWSLLAGSAAAWIAHRYTVGEIDGDEVAVLGDATCPRCLHVVTLAESAPGRSTLCAQCRQRLPMSWIATQLAVIAGCLAMLTTFGAQLVLVPFLWLVPVLVTSSVTDFRTMLIPKRVVWVGWGVGVSAIAIAAVAMGQSATVTTALAGSAAYFAFMYALHFVSPNNMGYGDVRFALVLGLYLGWLDLRLPIYGLLLGCIAYLVYALPQRLLKGREGRFAPFGPGLAMGTVLAVWLYSTIAPVNG